MSDDDREVEALVANAAVIRPGDKLLISTAMQLEAKTHEAILEALEKRLPGVEVIILQAITSAMIYQG